VKRDNLVEQLEQQIWDIQDREKGIWKLLQEAEKTLKTCEWSALEEQLSEAKQTLPGEPCFSSQPAFSNLNRRILDLESRKKTKEDKVKWYWARHLIIIRNAKAYLDAKTSGQSWGAQLQKDYNDSLADLKNFIQGVEKENLADCLYDLVGQARDMIVQMGGPPRDRTDQASANIGGPTSGRIDPPPDPCRGWLGSVPILDRNNQVTCICPSEKGLAWNKDKTACIDYRQAAVENTDCSRWPGSIPMWNNQTNRVECFCPQGLAWNRDRTMCIDARQAAVENTDCSRWPGSVPQWNSQTNRVECFCPQGMIWNRDRTACISVQQQQDQDRCQRLGSALMIARDRKDINQFRMLLAQARDCGFYQQALADLRRMEQELSTVRPQPQPSPPPKPQPQPLPPPDHRKWIVWHDCDKLNFTCIINLDRTTEDELRQRRSGRKLTIWGIYNTEQEARQATCKKFSKIVPGGQFALGILGEIGKDTYVVVKNFFYWDSRENRFKCREVK
jgi:hypothetical protein